MSVIELAAEDAVRKAHALAARELRFDRSQLAFGGEAFSVPRRAA
jgi:hypothetical protein